LTKPEDLWQDGIGIVRHHSQIDPWDVAAGVLFVREAGGKVTDFKGGEWAPKRSDLVFSNDKVHKKILKLISPL